MVGVRVIVGEGEGEGGLLAPWSKANPYLFVSQNVVVSLCW